MNETAFILGLVLAVGYYLYQKKRAGAASADRPEADRNVQKTNSFQIKQEVTQ
jgi:hypothetical protein